MNKKGELSSFSILTWMITAFLVVLFFAGLIYVMGILNDVFTQVGIQNEQNVGSPMYVNLSLASEQIWGTAYESIQALRIVSIVYILSLAGAIIIVGFLERKHPFLFIIYVLITLLAVLFAPTISNAYETVLSSNIYGGELANFTTSNFIILNLPIIVLVIGLLGGIGLFINLIRSPNEGEIK